MSLKKKLVFLDLLKQNAGSNFKQIVFFALVAGLSNTALLAVINTASHSVTHGEINMIYLGMFAVLMVMFYFTKRYILITTISLVENIIANIRVRLIDRVREVDLYQLDSLGTASIYARLTQDTSTLSQGAPYLVQSLQNVLMIVFILIYLALISITAFFAIVGALTTAVVLFLAYEKSVRSSMVKASNLEAQFFSLLNGMLGGIKELKLNRRKNQEVFDDIETNIEEGKNVKVFNSSQFARGSMFSEITLYMIIGVIIFIMPIFSQAHAEDITQITTAVFFIVSPLNRVVGSLPLFARSNVAIKNIELLEEQLQNVTSPAEHTDFSKYAGWKKIEMKDVYFEHRGPDGDVTFRSGPSSFTLNRGDNIFLTGGNGAGKSTFLKLLTSLYTPISGSILIDGVPVRGNDLFPYRELFFSIFTDFHLFERLYGVDADPDIVNATLVSLGMSPEKVRYEEEKFSNLNLSTGQRKRLALTACLMEDKSIFIMDEVAADQDPEFKKLFYAKLLPKWIKKDGKTVILATHDDGYFEYGNQVIMRDGKILQETEEA